MTHHAGFMVHDNEIDEPFEFRLPQFIRPIHYDLQYEFDWQKTRFHGVVSILFKALEPFNFIALHAKDLNVHTETIHRVDFRSGRRAFDEFHAFDYKRYDYWITSFQLKLKEGEYQIRLRFHGNMNHEDQIGICSPKFLGSSQRRSSTIQHPIDNIIASRFSPIFARCAFPCFDEPEMKATFTLLLVYPVGLEVVAISNMHVEHSVVEHNKTEVRFAATPPMSPHMLGFVIGELGFTAQTIAATPTKVTAAKAFEIRCFAMREKLALTEYAMSWSRALVAYLTNYFSYPYTLPKLDIVALPRLAVGMSEHWGLLYFDESLLLYDRQLNTNANKQRIVMLLAHALARNWLGGLVTVSWWDQVWMGKGLASYLEYKCLHELRPDWHMMEQFLIMELYPVMAVDAANTHALINPIDDTAQIPFAFDKISYMKSAVLIRMLEHLVGADFLQRELGKFIAKYAQGNAEVEDFIDVLQGSEPDVPLTKIFKSFTEQQGFPFVKVSRITANSFRLTQQRYLADPEDYNHKLRSSKIFFNWTIPITYTTDNDVEKVEQSVFFRHEKLHDLTLADAERVQWIKLNKDNVGYYRVNYTNELWYELTEAISADPTQFSVSDRAQLLSDAFAFSNACLLTFSVPLELTSYLSSETEFVPWYVAINELKQVAKLLGDTELYLEFMDFGQTLVKPLHQNTYWSDELPHIECLFRVAILDAACFFGNPLALSEATDLFTAWLEDENFKIFPDLKGIVLLYGMQQIGDNKTWPIVWQRYVSAKTALDRRRLLHALTVVRSSQILADLLKLMLDTESNSDEEIFKCFYLVSCNVLGRQIVWNYVRKSWPQLLQRFGKKCRGLSQLIPRITSEFKTHKQLDEVQDFIDENHGKGISGGARNATVDKIEYNIYWLSHHELAIKTWLRSHLYVDSYHTADDFFASKTEI